jgi:hypothetical protein
MLTFYATIDSDSVRPYMPDVPVLLPASSWARHDMKAPNLPEHITERAADCGGFVATFKWGDYKYTPEQYVDWLGTFAPSWAATMDYCCEPEVLDNEGIVQERQERTTAMAYHFWEQYKSAPWAWVPTIQGWDVADYQRHAHELAPLVAEMQAHYGPSSAFRVGIGTLCRRASPAMIRRVVSAVADELPGVGLHLWGVKLTLFQSPIAVPGSVVSVDSAAWNNLFGRGLITARQHYRQGMTQREYTYLVALPQYLAKVQTALESPKQLELFKEIA